MFYKTTFRSRFIKQLQDLHYGFCERNEEKEESGISLGFRLEN